MGVKAIDTYSLETYIQMDTEGEERFEFFDGFIRAMAGGSPNHSLIAGNLITALNLALRAKGKPCRTFTSDVKISIRSANSRCYPDVSIVCGAIENDPQEKNAITNPILVAEVISESTESLDRGEKFFAYGQLDSLKEYILVSQDQARIEIFSRTEDNTWRIEAFQGLEATIEIPALGIDISSQDVYYQVEELS